MTATCHIFRLRFTGPLHIANVRAGYDRSETSIASDTLYAAVASTWAMLGQSDWIGPSPSFALSSLFPYLEHQGTVRYFLPKPIGALRPQSPSGHKAWKKVQYLEHRAFGTWAAGGPLPDTDDYLVDKFYLAKPATSQAERQALASLMQPEVHPRVSVPRQTGQDAEPFYVERIWFAEGAGLYCLFVGNEQEYARVKSALQLLQHEGLGTDRKVGNGQFVLEETLLPADFGLGHKSSPSPGYWVNLSLFCPESPEQLANMLPPSDEQVAYDLVKRGGWITAEPFMSLRKRSVHMFREGSIFRAGPGGQLADGLHALGKTVDLRPAWNDPELTPIYRSGRALFVPVNLDQAP
jgi:CRISPR-associated protein Csm4